MWPNEQMEPLTNIEMHNNLYKLKNTRGLFRYNKCQGKNMYVVC